MAHIVLVMLISFSVSGLYSFLFMFIIKRSGDKRLENKKRRQKQVEDDYGQG